MWGNRRDLITWHDTRKGSIVHDRDMSAMVSHITMFAQQFVRADIK